MGQTDDQAVAVSISLPIWTVCWPQASQRHFIFSPTLRFVVAACVNVCSLPQFGQYCSRVIAIPHLCSRAHLNLYLA